MKLIFWGILSYKLQIICNLVVLIELTRSHWKILIFGQNEPQNINFSIYGHTYFGLNLAIFLSNRAEFFFMILMLFWKKSYFWREYGRGRHRGRHRGAKGSSTVSKTCFQTNRVWIPLKMPVMKKLIIQVTGNLSRCFKIISGHGKIKRLCTTDF